MQLTLDDDPRVTLHEAVRDAVRLITPKELCFKLGITPQYLSEALSGKNSKGFRLDWLPTVIAMAPIDAVLPILRSLADLRNLDLVRRKTRTPEEELEATRDAMRRLAPGVLALIDKELGK